MPGIKASSIKKRDNIVLRTIHGSRFLIDITDNFSNDRCSLYEINETGAFIWKNIDGFHSIDELTKLLQDIIIDKIDYQILYNDVSNFVGTLINKNFVEAQ